MVKIGDIVTDHTGSVKVERITFYRGFNDSLPVCVYHGIELKKDLTPTKKGDKREVYQNNIDWTNNRNHIRTETKL